MIKKIPFCDAETIGNMFYNIASNLPKKAFQKKEKNLLKSNKRNQEILDAFEKKLKESVKDMSLDTMTRALIGL